MAEYDEIEGRVKGDQRRSVVDAPKSKEPTCVATYGSVSKQVAPYKTIQSILTEYGKEG